MSNVMEADWRGWGTMGAPSFHGLVTRSDGTKHNVGTVAMVVPDGELAGGSTTDWSHFVNGHPVRILCNVVDGNGQRDRIPYTAIAMMLNP